MKPLIFNIFGNHLLAEEISKLLDFKIGSITLRSFPDEETYLKINDNVKDKDIIIIDSLERPNQKILPLLFVAETIRELGGKRIGLVAPYLAYMRQDKRFKPGEAITSQYFAKLLSEYFDWLITVDPHLHRYGDLNEIYSIPGSVIQSASQISKWITQNIKKPLLIGPDIESEQWVSEIARGSLSPYVILNKIRKGDHDVEVSIPEVKQYVDYQPVLIDDIISTGRTMIETIKHLHEAKMTLPICIGVHAVFADNSYGQLQNAGVKQIVTCNTISHISNGIDLSIVISNSIKQQLLRGMP